MSTGLWVKGYRIVGEGYTIVGDSVEDCGRRGTGLWVNENMIVGE